MESRHRNIDLFLYLLLRRFVVTGLEPANPRLIANRAEPFSTSAVEASEVLAGRPAALAVLLSTCCYYHRDLFNRLLHPQLPARLLSHRMTNLHTPPG